MIIEPCTVPECPNTATSKLGNGFYCEECFLEFENELGKWESKPTGETL
jgi:hypothetical protein